MEDLGVVFPSRERSVGRDQFCPCHTHTHTHPHVAGSRRSPAAPRPLLSGSQPLSPSTTDVCRALVGAGAADVVWPQGALRLAENQISSRKRRARDRGR